MPVLLFFFYAQARHWYNNYAFVMYFYSFWAVYSASAVFLYFVCIEVFRSAFSAFSGLQRLGTVVFRWAALVAVIVSFSTLSFEYPKVCIIPTIAFRLMRSVSLVELCLLAFLCLSMNALRLSFRSMVFGISLGFGVMCSSDLFAATFLYHNTSLISPLQFVGESLILVALGIWITYAALPERVRQPVLLPDNSTIYLWNEIAFSLDHTETQVAARQPGFRCGPGRKRSRSRGRWWSCPATRRAGEPARAMQRRLSISPAPPESATRRRTVRVRSAKCCGTKT